MTKYLKLYAWCSKCSVLHEHKRWGDGATGRDSTIHDWLVKVSPLVDQTHFKFVDVSYYGSVNFPLHKAYTPDTMVVWVQTWWNSATTGLEKRSQVPFAPGERRCRCASVPSGWKTTPNPGIFGIGLCLAVASWQEDCCDSMPHSLWHPAQ